MILGNTEFIHYQNYKLMIQWCYTPSLLFHRKVNDIEYKDKRYIDNNIVLSIYYFLSSFLNHIVSDYARIVLARKVYVFKKHWNNSYLLTS